MAKKAEAAQQFVPIEEVRDGVVLMKDGSYRAVLMASSINFALKSGDEQQAILQQFQAFLNSLDFHVQFFIQSRELDIRPYLALLEERYKEQRSDLMKVQVREYIDFVKSFTEAANIMTKSFFIVVPYSPTFFSGGEDNGVFKKMSSLNPFGGGKENEQNGNTSFEEARSQLEQRVAVVEQGVIRTGVRVVQLGTEEVIELFYSLFNPGESEKPLVNTDVEN